MKCPNCNAETQGSHCEYCGSELPQETTKKACCPKCGGQNAIFNRENQGEVCGRKAKQVIHLTVGMCNDCGYTWNVNADNALTGKKRTWLWVLGWIFIFPVPLTILMLRRKNLKTAVKYGIIIVAWLAYFLFILLNKASDSSSSYLPSGNETVNDSLVLSSAIDEIQNESFLEQIDNSIDVGKSEQVYFPSDAKVNGFICKFNAFTDNPIMKTEIKQGNIRTKALVNKEDYNMEVVSTDEALFVSLSTSPENEPTILHDLFSTCIIGMRESISVDEIEAAWSNVHETGYMVEEYEISDVLITYVPYIELSSGHANLRIDLTFPTT